MDCKETAGRKESCYGQLYNPANAHGHWDGVMALQMGLRQIWFIYWSQHDLLLDTHLQLFLILGCDSLWNQMFRIITIICEFLCIHTLLIGKAVIFFFSFSIHVHKCDSYTAACTHFSGLGKKMKQYSV